MHHSDGEDGIRSGVAEESVDLMAQSENSPSVTDLNECVGAALYEGKGEDEFIQINVGLASFGCHLYQSARCKGSGVHMVRKKFKKVVEVLSEKLGVSHDPDADADSEIIAQLKEKFKATTNRSEKIQILTVLPNSWSLGNMMQEFGVSNYMARCAKKARSRKGYTF